MMKHLLFGTSALVAIASQAGATSAAEAIKLGLGGFYAASMGANFGGDDDGFDAPGDTTAESGAYRNDFDIHQNIEVHVLGETTLDNGVTVRAHIEYEGDDDSERIDESWVSFSGGFGEIRAGRDDEASVQTCVGDPSTVTRNFGVNSPEDAFNNAGVNGLAGVDSFGSCYGTALDGLKLLYFTPQFGPFSFVVSYAPEANAADKGPEAGTSLDTPLGVDDDQEDQVSVGANFIYEEDDWSLTSSLGASFILDDTSDSDKTEFYQAGLQLGFGGLTVGAAGEIIDNYDDAFLSGTPTGLVVAPDSDLWTAQAGVSYAWGDWIVGLGWTHGQMEITSGGDEDTIDYISLNGAYALGPGIALEGNIGYVSYDDDDNAQTADYDSFEVDFGTSIDF